MSIAFNEGPQTGISLETLRRWLSWQLGKWDEWAAAQDNADWLAVATGNPKWPTAGHMLVHAFSPVRRYAERTLGREPFDDSQVPADDWQALTAFARECLEVHASAAASFSTEAAREEVPYQTRSAGVWTITPEEAFVHALTHCYWHLGGVVHLLRANGIEPPQWNDLIFYAAGLHAQEQSAGS
ncbi:MAG: DinB family protein [bacterium]